MTAYTIYSQPPSIVGCGLLHPQELEEALFHDERVTLNMVWFSALTDSRNKK
jgi:hypothetical protein